MYKDSYTYINMRIMITYKYMKLHWSNSYVYAYVQNQSNCSQVLMHSGQLNLRESVISLLFRLLHLKQIHAPISPVTLNLHNT